MRVLIVSHPAVLEVNQLVYADLVAREFDVHLLVPNRWCHEYGSSHVAPTPVPALSDSFRTARILCPGRPQRHVYLANPVRIIRSVNPSVIFLEQEPTSLVAMQWGSAARFCKVPFGVQMDENLDRHYPQVVRTYRRWILEQAAFIAARSPGAVRLAGALGAKGEVSLIPHHVPGWTRPERVPSDFFRIGFAGRLVPEKGLRTLVEAVRLLPTPAELVVVGDGPMRSWLEEADLGDSVLRLDRGKSHAGMDAAYANMDVLILPSTSTQSWVEQFGRVLVEALSCGVPVIGANTGEIPWIIAATNGGLVFPAGDAPALAEAIETLRNNEVARHHFAETGSANTRQLFGVGAVSAILGPVLNRASKPRDGSPYPSNARPQVALVAHGIHDAGGMERACSELIRRTHNDVRYLVIATELAPELEHLVERWVRVRIWTKPIPMKMVLFFVAAGFALRRERPDLTHTIGAIIPNRVDLASVHFCHTAARAVFGGLAPAGAPWIRRANSGLARGLAVAAERWSYRPARARSFAVVSPGLAAEMAVHYPGVPTHVTANGVNIDRFHPDARVKHDVRSGEGLGETETVALFVGGDWDRKGLAVALKGLGLARSAGAVVRLWVVGSGDQCRFSNLAASEGVTPWVRFFGMRSDTERFYQSADLFVLPSSYETFSIVSYEAAACGLPIVGTAVSGVSELIGSNEAGVLIAPTASAVAAAFTELASDPERRCALGLEARMRASKFTWDGSANAILSLYRSLLRPKFARPDVQ